jgi:hypothetical protein
MQAAEMIVADTFARFAADRIRQDLYVGEHRGAVTGLPWPPYVPRHARDGRYQEATEALVRA